MKTFQGRVVTPGCAQAEALVTHGGLNTLASFQKSLQFGDKTAKCGDQNNPDLYGKPMAGKALCLPQTIGSTTGGLVLYCACAMDRQPACMLFANPIDSLAAAGAILADVWLQPGKMPVVDSLGEEFLSYVKDGMTVTIGPNGTVTVEALGAPAPVHQSGLHEKEVPLPAGPLFLVLNRSYRFGTITARKRVTEPVWLRMEWVWPSAQNSASPTCSSRLSPSSVTVAAPSRM